MPNTPKPPMRRGAPAPAPAPARSAPQITKAEAAQLQQLINRRERVLKQVAVARSAELLADFEPQMAAQYSFDDREVWAQATRRGQEIVDDSNKRIAAECAALGIPSQFAPKLIFGWLGRGENAIASRRAELRRVAQTRIEAIEKRAIVQISHEALNASTEVVGMGLVSEAATKFLNELAPLERLMPPLDFQSIEETLIGTPITGRYGLTSGTFERLTITPVVRVDDEDEAAARQDNDPFIDPSAGRDDL